MNCAKCKSKSLRMATVGPEKAPIIRVSCLDCGATVKEYRWTEDGTLVGVPAGAGN